MQKKTDKLRELLKTNKYEWLDEHQRAFEEMKECPTSETTLAYFIPKRKTELVVDGAQEGLSAILAQEDPNLKSLEWCHMPVEHVLMLKEDMHQLKESAWQQSGEQRSIIIICLEAHSN